MNKFLIISMVFLFSLIASVSAENETNSTKAQTFGTCVADAAYAKNDCFAEAKATAQACMSNETDSEALKACKNEYKLDKKECKVEFKKAKMECKKIKHNAFDAVGAVFARKAPPRAIPEDATGAAIARKAPVKLS